MSRRREPERAPLYRRVEPPQIIKPKRVKEYDDLLNAISNEPPGWYEVNIPNRKTTTVYLTLARKLKGRTDLKLHYINKVVYIEKL